MPAPTGGTRVFRLLLKLYPREFRNQYGAEMTRDFRENLEREGSSFQFWIRTFWDVISSAGRERLLGGRNMRNVMVKFGGIAAVVHGLVFPVAALLVMTQKWNPEKPVDAMAVFINLLATGLLLPFIVVASFFHLSRPHTRVEYLGCFLAITTPLLLVIGNQLLIQPENRIPTFWIGWIHLIGQFGLPIGLALMGLARVRITGMRDLSRVSEILFGLAVVLFITSAIWRVIPANTLGSDVMTQLGMIVFFVERLIWIPLAWVLLTSQKLSIPSRAQPA